MAVATVHADTATMFQVRAAVAADAHDAARVHVRSWRSAYRGLLTQEYLDSLDVDAVARRYAFGRVGVALPSTLVAVDGSVICGLATTGLCHDVARGELTALYVDPAYLRRGVGRLLITAARDRLRGIGVAEALLWVLDANARARRFYERDGWRPDGSYRTVLFGELPVTQARYRRTPV